MAHNGRDCIARRVCQLRSLHHIQSPPFQKTNMRQSILTEIQRTVLCSYRAGIIEFVCRVRGVTFVWVYRHSDRMHVCMCSRPCALVCTLCPCRTLHWAEQHTYKVPECLKYRRSTILHNSTIVESPYLHVPHSLY